MSIRLAGIDAPEVGSQPKSLAFRVSIARH